MQVEEEIRDILFRMKGLLGSYEEMGMPPPPLSDRALRILATQTSGRIPSDHSPTTRPHAGRPTGPASLEDLRKEIGDCTRCKLHRKRTNLVFGEGSPGAQLIFVGEGPGREEDMAGRPFVGESGKLLTRIIENGMGLRRKDVYICNVVKCHPPGNRDPEGDEVDACLPFLKRQLRIIRPGVICCLGRVACQTLIRGDFQVTKERGRWHSFEGIPLMPTYHPAYLLRNPSAKRAVWEDIKKVMNKLGLEVKTDA